MKAARRQEARQRKSTTPVEASGEDPDIAGIVPGPQPSPWGDELDDFLADDEEGEDEDQDQDQDATSTTEKEKAGE